MNKKIIISVLVCALLACFYLFRMIYMQAEENAISQLNSRQTIYAEQAKRDIEYFFNDIVNFMSSISKSKHIINLDKEGIAELKIALTVYPKAITALTRVGPQGDIIYTVPYNQSAIGKNISSQPHVKNIMRTRKPVASDVFTSVQGYRAIAVHVPIFDGDVFKGTLGALIDFSLISKRFVEGIRLGKTGYAWITSAKGIELYCPVPGHTGKSVFKTCEKFPSIISMAKKMVAGGRGTAIYNFNYLRHHHIKYVKKHAVYMPVNIVDNFWTIVVASSEEEALKPLIAFRNKIILAAAAFLIVSIIFIYFGVKAIVIVKNDEQRRAAEAALRESEEKFRDFAEQSLVGMYLVKDGYFSYVNAKFADIFGYTVAECIDGIEFKSLVFPDDIPIVEDNVKRRELGELDSIQYTFRGVKKSGDIVYLEVFGSIITINGQPVASGTLLDITDRKHAEAALRKSEEKFAKAFTYSPMLMSLTSLEDGTIIDVNKEWCKISGYPREESIGRNTVDLGWIALRERQAFHEKLIEQGRISEQELVVRVKGGRLINVLVNAEVIEIEGKPLVLLGGVDITERKEAERRLQLLGYCIENASVAIFWVSPDGRFIKVNKKASEELGYSIEELECMGVHDLYSNLPEHAREEHWERIKREKVVVVETEHQGRDGNIIFHEVTSHYMKFEGEEMEFAFAKDITRQKQEESGRKQSEERLGLALDSVSDAVWDWRLDTGEIYFSPRWYTMLGYEPDEFPQDFDTWRKLVYPDDLPEAEKRLTSHVESCEPFEAEFRMRTKSGGWKWILGRGKVVEINDQGKAVRMLGTHVDINYRKLAEEALRKSEQKYKLLADNSSDVIWIRDMEFNLTYVSPAVERVRGFTVEEVLKQKLNDVLTPGSAKMALELFSTLVPQAVTGEQADNTLTVDLEHKCKDGNTKWLECHLSLLRDDAGEVLGILGVSRDINDRKNEEKSRKEAEERFRKAFETSPDAININRLSDGTYVEVNDGFLQILGFDREDIIGKTSLELDIWVNPNDRNTLVEGLKEKGYYSNLEAQFRRKDGSTTYGLMSASVIQLNGEPHIISITRDIGDLRKAQEERAQLREQLQQAQKMDALGTLSSGIAHDFNNILAAIMGYAELALEDLPRDIPMRDDLTAITKAATKARNLVRQILTFSRAVKGEKRSLSINKVAKEATTILERTLPKMISLKLELQGGVHPVKADPQQMEQIFINLATNAGDAIEGNGNVTISTQNVSVENKVCAGCGQEFSGQYVLITVKDDGSGMRPEVQEKIYDPFFTTKGVGRGTGLGLSTVFGIVTGHGGHIQCESRLGEGTEFLVYLPAADEMVHETRSSDGITGVSLNGSGTILLVDDDSAVRSIAEKMLSRSGYDIMLADRGEAALNIFRDHSDGIDLVIMDLGMPGMGGKACLQEMIALDPKARVLIASGYIEYEQTGELESLGAVGLVTKPYRMADLLGRVREILGDGRSA